MGGSSKQTIGYKYFAGLMVVIGNPIEKFLGINADNRGWIYYDDNENQDTSLMVVDKPNLFGGSNQEGGWVGVVDIHHGKDTQEQNQYLAKNIDPDISAYPNLSYLVFRGYDSVTQSENLSKGFEVVSMSGMLKDFMLWVKRIHIKNNGDLQWYDTKSEIPYLNNSFESISTISKNIDIIMDEANTRLQNIWYGTKKINGGAFEPIPDYEDYSRGLKGTNGVFHFDSGTQGNIGDIGYIKTNFNMGLQAVIEITLLCDDGLDSISWSGESFGVIDEWEQQGWITCKRIQFLTTSSGEGELVVGVINGFPSGSDTQHRVVADCVLAPPSSDILVKSGDINPIHKIREILTDYTAMNKPQSLINDINFKDSANRIYDEGLGISWCIQEKSCKEAIDELLYHAEAGLRINRQTGFYEVILFRDDLLDLDNSILFNESNIKSINFDIANLDESISSINVSYYDRELIKDSSFLLYENGLERTRGFSISENIDFPYFMNKRNAEKVGNWKLKQLSSPTWKGSFKTGIIEARNINKYDVVKLSWKSKNLIDLPVRILNINIGDGINNTVTIDFIEVIPYSNISYTNTNTDKPIDDNMSPQFNSNIAIEMPYFEAVQRFTQSQVDLELSNSPEIGYLMASAARPQNNSLNAHLYTDKATGIYTNMSKVGVVDYCPAVYLDGGINFVDTILKINNLDAVSANNVSAFNGATKGTWIFLNNEIMVYESFNPETMEITVKRGALDTVPQKHESGIIFFSDEFSGIDPNQYIQGETVQYQVLTTTPSSIKGLEPSDSKYAEFNSRAVRPYPPANVKINGEYYPDEIESDLIITWVDRNRLQQTGGNIIGWFDNGITLESNTTYQLIISEYDENMVILRTQNLSLNSLNSYTFPTSSMGLNTRIIEITLKSIRGQFESYQNFKHRVELSTFFSSPYNIEYKVSDS